MDSTTRLKIKQLLGDGYTIKGVPSLNKRTNLVTVRMQSKDGLRVEEFHVYPEYMPIQDDTFPDGPKWVWPAITFLDRKHSFHKRTIPRGELGEFSKIEEEFLEAKDAVEQENFVLLLVELCDILGAIKLYMQRHWPKIGFPGLVKMSDAIHEHMEAKRCGQPV